MAVKKRGFIVLNKTVLPYIVLFLLAIAFSIHSREDNHAYLHISSTPSGLPVYHNNAFIGNTPLHHYAIEPGNHHIVIYSPYWPSWNIDNFEKHLVVYKDQTYPIKATFPKMIYINSLPYDANVYADDNLLGKTPLYLAADTLKTIRLVKKGYLPSSIRLDSLQRMAVVELTPNKVYARERLEQTRQKDQKLRLKKNLFWASMAVTVAAGLSTIHFRSKGRDEYDNYMHTITPKKMNEHFENSRFYDRLAGFSYALFESGFVLSGYFFLSSRREE